MDNYYYTVDKVAEKLAVHSRTVLRFIRDGKLKATKVGRQWRIKKEDLNAFAGEPSGERRSSASSVIDLPVTGREEANRYQTLVTAALNSRRKEEDEVHHRVDSLYNDEEQMLRFILWGSIGFMKDFYTLIDRY